MAFDKEQEILDFWKKKKIYEKTKVQRKNSKKFYFLDGPPYATGAIHIGTAYNKILKDCYIRFFRMSGFNTWDQPGYDTHGVPIENKVEKKMGFSTKKDIEKFGVENFTKECKNFVSEFIPIMNDQFQNLGVWMDWSNPYITFTNEYIEGAWHTFKKAFEKGFLFRGAYPVHVCSHCETAVAFNEIEHKTVTDPSIYVKFKIKDKQNEFLLIWTTTPWTLPANTGVMAKPYAEYVKVKVGDEILIMAKQLLETVMKKAKIDNYEVVESFVGKDLEGVKYEHPLADIFSFQKNLKNAHRVVLSDQFVTLDDGTGLVHTAPGHGQEDYKAGQQTGLPAVSPVKMDGTFNEQCGKFSGVFVKDADKQIIQELRDRNLLLHQETIDHEYPMCWRCDSPLLLISVPQWFFKVTAIRDKLIQENKKVNWIPQWAGQRFHNWLESLGDWPISRQRFWGIPLPIWTCKKCEHVKVVGSRDELPNIPEDFHRPYIDEVVLKCEKCGSEMKRIPDVLDVWFDSGVAPWASLGYPKNKKLFEKMWPADFILEGPDQIRGWWNSLMITSMMTFGRRSFDNVLFHGFVLDKHGVKMSKSKGNIITPEELVEKYGRDVTRFYFLSSPPWDDYFFKREDIEDIAKSFVIVRNTFNFVKTYVPKVGKPKSLKAEDKWILSRLNTLIENCTEYCKTFNAHKAAQEILNFVLNDFSRWYIKVIRDRTWPAYDGKDKDAAFSTLYTVSETLTRLLAPFTPFMTEEIYQEIISPLKKGKESVHLNDWPKANKKLIDKKIERRMEIVKYIFEACSAARNSAGLKLRWPIRRMVIMPRFSRSEFDKKLLPIIAKMCNVKSIEMMKTVNVTKKPKGEFEEADIHPGEYNYGKIFIDKKLDEELMNEAMLREIAREVQSMRKKHGLKVEEHVLLTLNSDADTNKILKGFAKDLKKEVGAKEVDIGISEGEYESEVKFADKKISVAFSKLN